MEIKTICLQMTNSMTMFAFKNLFHVIFISLVIRFFMDFLIGFFIYESCTQKLNWFGVFWNMKSHRFFISKSFSLSVVSNFFPRSDDGLGKIISKLLLWHHLRLIFCMLLNLWNVFFIELKRKHMNCRFMNTFIFIFIFL